MQLFIRSVIATFAAVFASSLVYAQSRTNEMRDDSSVIQGAKALRPDLYCIKYGDDWEATLQFTPVTHFERFTWLLTANPFGGQIQVCSTNGIQCTPTNRQVRQAFDLPFFTTVSNALKGTDASRRGLQWPPSDVSFQTAAFSLKSAFGMSFTNDVFFQLIPLMYRENTNNQTAWLVEFPAIRVKLKADCTVEKLE